MNITKTSIDGLIVFSPKIHSDERGYFFENFRRNHFDELNLDIDFVQENESMSQENTIRGLHLQAPPFAQDKLIRVIKGSILDVGCGKGRHAQYFNELGFNENDIKKLKKLYSN
mgnify:CR=1 FL=1